MTIENEREKKGKEERKGDWQEMMNEWMNDEQTRKRRDDWKMIELKFGKIDWLIDRKKENWKKKESKSNEKQTNKQTNKSKLKSHSFDLLICWENWRERTNKMKREIDR